MSWLTQEQWSPYIVGIGIGVLDCLAFILSDTYIGCSGAFAKTSGMIEKFCCGEKASQKSFYQKINLSFDWSLMLLAGIVIGAFISAYLSGQLHFAWVPSFWAQTIGTSPVIRWAGAVLGGILVGFGGLWAGGCTSGHGISGTLQLAVSSWIAMMMFFAGGVATAFFMYKIIF